MLRRALASAVLAAGMLLGCAGCSGAAEALRTTPPAPASPTPLATPTRGPGEVTRTTVDGATPADGTGPLPRTGQIAVEVACSGTDGSELAWRLEAGDGAPLGLSGRADCTAPPTTSWLGITADPRPARVRVVLDPGVGVGVGWAVVRSGRP